MFLLQHGPPSHRGSGCTRPGSAGNGVTFWDGQAGDPPQAGGLEQFAAGSDAPELVQLLPLQPLPALWCAGAEAARAARELTGAILGGPPGSDRSNWGTSQPPPG